MPLRRHKQAETEVAGVAEEYWAFDWLGKGDADGVAAFVVVCGTVTGSAWLVDFHPA